MTQFHPLPTRSSRRAFRRGGTTLAATAIAAAGLAACSSNHHSTASPSIPAVTLPTSTATGGGNGGRGLPAAVRAAILRDAPIDINTLTTMDYRTFDADLANWLSVSTGALHSQFTQAGQVLKSQFVLQKLATSGKITAIDITNATTAAATLAGQDDEVITSGTAQITKHNSFQADVTLTASGWKLTRFDTTEIKS